MPAGSPPVSLCTTCGTTAPRSRVGTVSDVPSDGWRQPTYRQRFASSQHIAAGLADLLRHPRSQESAPPYAPRCPKPSDKD